MDLEIQYEGGSGTAYRKFKLEVYHAPVTPEAAAALLPELTAALAADPAADPTWILTIPELGERAVITSEDVENDVGKRDND